MARRPDPNRKRARKRVAEAVEPYDGGEDEDCDDDDDAPPTKKKKRAWPYALALIAAWGFIFGAVFFSRFLSDLPDVSTLLVRSASHDITLLDVHGRLIARRGLTQGAMIDVKNLPDYVPNAFIAIEDRRFRDHLGLDPIGLV